MQTLTHARTHIAHRNICTYKMAHIKNLIGSVEYIYPWVNRAVFGCCRCSALLSSVSLEKFDQPTNFSDGFSLQCFQVEWNKLFLSLRLMVFSIIFRTFVVVLHHNGIWTSKLYNNFKLVHTIFSFFRSLSLTRYWQQFKFSEFHFKHNSIEMFMWRVNGMQKTKKMRRARDSMIMETVSKIQYHTTTTIHSLNFAMKFRSDNMFWIFSPHVKVSKHIFALRLLTFIHGVVVITAVSIADFSISFCFPLCCV